MEILRVENITKTYANHVALRDVNVAIPRGSIYGLLGPNGAGKTSLIRIITQITGPDSGKIMFNDESLNQSHISRMGYLPEERGLYKKMKVGEQALYLAQLKGMSKADANKKLKEWFERFEIETWWNKKVEELSKGMAQKVQFVTTVMHEPEFIILDEPFSGFDPINANLIKSEIKRLAENGTTIMLSTHDMGSVEQICTHIGLIHNATKVLEGPIGEVREKYKEHVYELEFDGDMISFTNALWTNFELIHHSPSITTHSGHANSDYPRSKGKSHTAKIKLINNSTVNDLLNHILPVVEVKAVNEVIPTMNEIFMKVVENKASDEQD